MEQATVRLDLPIPIPGRLRFSLQNHLPLRVVRLGPKSSHLDQGVAVEINLVLALRGPTARRNGAVHPMVGHLTNFGPLIGTICVGFIPTTYAQSTWEGDPFSRREVTFRMGISGI